MKQKDKCRSNLLIAPSLMTRLVVLSAATQYVARAMNTTVVPTVVNRPIIHTFFHRIDQENRFTGMTDDDDDELLSFWKESWLQAGWEPVILSLQDAETHPRYHSLKNTVQSLHLDEFSTLLFMRWIAMVSVGGGWYADYDVFPIRDFPEELPNNGTMTIFDVMSPTLASGNADEWTKTLDALLEEAVETQNSSGTTNRRNIFWTDSLGVLNLVAKDRYAPKREKRVGQPYGAKDPILTSNDCNVKSFRSRWVVHFGQGMVQSAEFVPNHLRIPNGRLALAREWLPKWRAKCYQAASPTTKSAAKHNGTRIDKGDTSAVVSRS